jgi:hypothetical protein
VNVQDFCLLPLLEQAPDHTASRPSVTERVMLLPDENEACMLLPVATLIPGGLEVTCSPLRPVALTVNTFVVGGGGAAGLRVSGARTFLPPAVAKIVSPVVCVTTGVGRLNENVVAPAGTVTDEGTVTIGLLVESATANPPAGAGLDNPIMARVG